ncbi:MAG: ABC transporter ATP-binding protein [Clostridia bacterium]|nr:ABC transporter ATP-binding protein [Clostridia bacterium]
MSVTIKIEHAVKKFGSNTVIKDLSLTVEQGEFFTLLGSSGCGKTTLLRMIAGFNSIEGGDFYFNDKRINDMPPYKRNIGMVFQNYAIFPHMNTFNNVAFGLKQQKVREPELSRRVNEMLETVQISELRDRMPKNMSGGQQQRIALARAIVMQPDVLLMDEPLSNLDAKLRVEMRTAIKHIQNACKITTIYVTHDQEEALAISDRIAVMREGVIQQVGAPITIYQHPANLFVATFIGQSSLMDATALHVDGQPAVKLYDGSVRVLPGMRADIADGTALKLCIRPNEFHFADEGLNASVEERVFFGDTMRYTLRLDNGQVIEIKQDIHQPLAQIGEKVKLSFRSDVVNAFDAHSEVSVMKEVVQA